MSTHHHRRPTQSQLIRTQTLREEIAKHPFRRRVDPLNNALDFHAAVLAGFGMSSRYIASTTGLSAGQIYYRLRRASVKISDYRNGKGVIAERMLKEHQEECEPLLRKHIAAVVRAHGHHS